MVENTRFKKTPERLGGEKTELLWRAQEENHEAIYGKMAKGFQEKVNI